jgi:hypothetical protein
MIAQVQSADQRPVEGTADRVLDLAGLELLQQGASLLLAPPPGGRVTEQVALGSGFVEVILKHQGQSREFPRRPRCFLGLGGARHGKHKGEHCGPQQPQPNSRCVPMDHQMEPLGIVHSDRM